MTDHFDDGGGELTGALMFLMESVIHPILAATAGYRSELIEMGFATDVADDMAAEFHSMLMGRVESITGSI
jgi:hypothetical protein